MKNIARFSDVDGVRALAHRLSSYERPNGREALPRFGGAGAIASSAPVALAHAPTSWSELVAIILRTHHARAAFVTNPDGLLIASAGDVGGDALEAVAARLSAALDQATRVAPGERTTSELCVRGAEGVWSCTSVPTPLGAFVVGCLAADAPASAWSQLSLESVLAEQLRGFAQ